MTSFTQNVLKFKLQQAAILGLDHKSRGEKTWMASIVNSPPTTITWGYFAIQISSQTTKKDDFEILLL